ncbi:MAG: Rieske 2Fe-2S domain-containing protein [Cellulomonadaceae bacterium]|jgi:3-phenylpropionate/trans-cinnamate dioxygenase ferredoxin subunit|nr:Rieske 2Fe-2S domain-containing protein [Cellulomonadaceae bacterium]
MTAQRVCTTADLTPGTACRVELADGQGGFVVVAVVRDADGGWHAIADACTHGDVDLSEGDVVGCSIECWGHGARFDLRTGAGTLPATAPVAVYPVVMDGDDVLIDIDNPLTLPTISDAAA